MSRTRFIILSVGTDAVLVKPVDAGTLRRTMKQLLATAPRAASAPAPA